MAKEHWKTIEDIVKFIESNEVAFVYWDYGDYEINTRIMWDIISYMWRDWYLEELHQPDSYWWAEFLCADYYDDVVKDVICFDTDIYWRFQNSAQEVADYMWNMNERYKDTKRQYESMYTISECFKKIFSLFNNDKHESD